MSNANKRLVLAQRPRYGVPSREVFRLESVPVPQAGKGQILVRTTWLSLDPDLYGRVARVSPHFDPLDLGSVMVGATVGQVEVSNHPDFRIGETVCGAWGWQSYHRSDGSDVRKADPEVLRPSHLLSAFGLSAFAAYIAVCELLQVKAGESMSFGAALGGLGQMVGQIGKLRGARIIAVSSSPEKCRYAEEQLGFDVCIDRKSDDFLERVTAEYAKSGVDCIVMAVGPMGVKLAIPHFRRGARVAVCGLIGSYAAGGSATAQDSMGFLLQEINLLRLKVYGVVAADAVGTSLEARFRHDMKQWIREGKVKPVEHIVEGLENAPDAFRGLFEGANLGKAVVRVGD